MDNRCAQISPAQDAGESTMNQRAACDRCRKQKLRCARTISSDQRTCDRCQRIGTICRTGYRLRSGRPSLRNRKQPDRHEERPNHHRRSLSKICELDKEPLPPSSSPDTDTILPLTPSYSCLSESLTVDSDKSVVLPVPDPVSLVVPCHESCTSTHQSLWNETEAYGFYNDFSPSSNALWVSHEDRSLPSPEKLPDNGLCDLLPGGDDEHDAEESGESAFDRASHLKHTSGPWERLKLLATEISACRALQWAAWDALHDDDPWNKMVSVATAWHLMLQSSRYDLAGQTDKSPLLPLLSVSVELAKLLATATRQIGRFSHRLGTQGSQNNLSSFSDLERIHYFQHRLCSMIHVTETNCFSLEYELEWLLGAKNGYSRWDGNRTATSESRSLETARTQLHEAFASLQGQLEWARSGLLDQ